MSAKLVSPTPSTSPSPSTPARDKPSPTSSCASTTTRQVSPETRPTLTLQQTTEKTLVAPEERRQPASRAVISPTPTSTLPALALGDSATCSSSVEPQRAPTTTSSSWNLIPASFKDRKST